LGGVAKGGF